MSFSFLIGYGFGFPEKENGFFGYLFLSVSSRWAKDGAIVDVLCLDLKGHGHLVLSISATGLSLHRGPEWSEQEGGS